MVLRSKGLRLSLLGLVVVAAGSGITYARTRPEPIKQPRLRWTQTDAGVSVHVHNDNRTWALRDQRLIIILVGEQHNIIRSYGPNEKNTWEGSPGKSIPCCLIDDLPPRGDFTFNLWPTKTRVAGVTFQLDDGAHWVRQR